MNERSKELKNTTYEIFIGLLSVLSIVNIVLFHAIPSEDVSEVVTIMDALLTVVFMADFLFRLFSAKSKSAYFFRGYGWADLISSLPVPQLKILRAFRIMRVSVLLRQFGLSHTQM